MEASLRCTERHARREAGKEGGREGGREGRKEGGREGEDRRAGYGLLVDSLKVRREQREGGRGGGVGNSPALEIVALRGVDAAVHCSVVDGNLLSRHHVPDGHHRG